MSPASWRRRSRSPSSFTAIENSQLVTTPAGRGLTDRRRTSCARAAARAAQTANRHERNRLPAARDRISESSACHECARAFVISAKAVQDRDAFLLQRRRNRREIGEMRVGRRRARSCGPPGSRPHPPHRRIQARARICRARRRPKATPREYRAPRRFRRWRRTRFCAASAAATAVAGRQAVGRERAFELQQIDAVFGLGEFPDALDHQRRQLAWRFHIVRGVIGAAEERIDQQLQYIGNVVALAFVRRSRARNVC